MIFPLIPPLPHPCTLCRPVGPGLTRVTWYKDSEVIHHHDSERTLIHDNLLSDDVMEGVLEIKYADVADSGEYRVEAANKYGLITEVFSINVAAKKAAQPTPRLDETKPAQSLANGVDNAGKVPDGKRESTTTVSGTGKDDKNQLSSQHKPHSFDDSYCGSSDKTDVADGGQVPVSDKTDVADGGQVPVSDKTDVADGGQVPVSDKTDVAYGGQVSVSDKTDVADGGQVSVTVVLSTDCSEESDVESSADEGEYELHTHKCPVTGKPKKRVSFAEPIESSVEVERSESEFTTASEDSSEDSEEDTTSSEEESETESEDNDGFVVSELATNGSAIGEELLKEIMKTFGESELSFQHNENLEDPPDYPGDLPDYPEGYPRAFRNDMIQSAELVEHPVEAMVTAEPAVSTGRPLKIAVATKTMGADDVAQKSQDIPDSSVPQAAGIPDIKTDTKPDTKPDAIPDTKPDTKPDAKPSSTEGKTRKSKDKKLSPDEKNTISDEGKKKPRKKSKDTAIESEIMPFDDGKISLPVFTVAPMSVVNVKLGHMIKLACRVQGQRPSCHLECHL